MHTYMHTCQPRNTYNFRVKYLHNFQVCVLPESVDFQNFHIFEMWKSDNSGNKEILKIRQVVHLVPYKVSSLNC